MSQHHTRDNESPLRTRLQGLSDREREPLLVDAIRGVVADLLGLPSLEDVDPAVAFADHGFDSLAGVEIARMLGEQTQLDLPVTLGFDYPSPAAAGSWLASQLAGTPAGTSEPMRGARALDAQAPIAIVGMSCRYPGGVRSPEDLWDLVAAGREGISLFPKDRGWDVDMLYDPNPDTPHSTSTRHGGFIDGVAEFDAAFFGIGEREALAMDPQQRLILQGAWEACEHAGIDPTSLRGTPTGVFVGLATHDYYAALYRARPPELEGYVGTGTSGSVVSGRIAYTLGLEGPAMTIDTACSSSLVGIHLACQALRAGECTLALAGGVSVMASPHMFVEFSRSRALSPDGRCRSFSAEADGTGWAEGVGLLVLEPLSEAYRRNHKVLAVVRGSAINQDGASNGLSAPNGPSQEQVIRTALADAELTPADIDAVDGHGTGTTLGDPIEARALLSTYGSMRPNGQPLWLGSLKSNIGHAQAAAGVGGVIKMVEALQHEELPQTLHANTPSPHVEWRPDAITLLTEPQPWPRSDRVRRAAVSAFGISGTNAHVVLEEAPAQADSPSDAAPTEGATGHAPLGGAVAWSLSAKDDEGLARQAERLRAHVRTRPQLADTDIGHALATTRARLSHRAVVVGATRGELLAGLDALARGEDDDQVLRGVARPGRVAFLFPGQGSQWSGMALGLLDVSPLFAERLRDCDVALAPHVDWSLEAVLRRTPNAPTLDRVDIVQPALFSMMVALAALWRACGVEPDVVVGHSQGEIAAAQVAGALSLEDAARVVALRSKALASLAGHGGMVSIQLTGVALESRLERYGERIALAARNGPSAQVVAGESDALDELITECERDGVWARRIPVDYASHTRQIEAIREELLELLAPIAPRASGVPFYSTVDGAVVDPMSLDAAYWYRNLRQPVQFAPAIQSLVGEGVRTFVEVSAHPVLTVGVQEAAEAADGGDEAIVLGTLRRDDGGPRRFLSAIARVHVHGRDLDFARLTTGAERIELPTYPFARQRHWFKESISAEGVEVAGLGAADHPFLGAAVEMAGGEGWLFTGRLSLETHPWLVDHAVLDVVLVSGTALVELALYGGARLGCRELEELVLETPLVVPQDGAVSLQMRISEPDDAGRRDVSLHSRVAGLDAGALVSEGFARNARGVLAPGQSVSADAPWPAWPPEGVSIDVPGLYETLSDEGFGYGTAYRGLQNAWQTGDEVLAAVALHNDHAVDADRFSIHPALLDATFHAMGALLMGDGGNGPRGAFLPFAWSGVRIHREGARELRVRLRAAGPTTVSMVAVDELGRPVVSVKSVTVRPASAEHLERAHGAGYDLFRIAWAPSLPDTGAPEAPDSVVAPDALVVLGDAHLGFEGARLHASLAALTASLEKGAPLPTTVVVDARADASQAVPDASGAAFLRYSADAVRAAAGRTLALLQEWLADGRFTDVRLTFVTRLAQAASPGELPALAEAPVWGLVRTAQSEYPGRFALIDTDDEPESRSALAAALAAGEPQIALRDGALLVPRLKRTAVDDGADAPTLNPDGTVLITGGTSGLGALVARHLASSHAVRHLLLVSRGGPAAEGVGELERELAELGATATIRACDIANRNQVAALVASVPQEHPLTAIVHSAGVLDDGLLASLTPDRVDRVMRPKVDAALCLDELTAEIDLVAFVVFSSVAGAFGSAGQGNYAAANAFLDALAHHRRARGLAATSIAWGLWGTESNMIDHLDQDALARLAREGLQPISVEGGLRLFDAALSRDAPYVVAARFDKARLRSLAKSGDVPVLLRGLIGAPERRARNDEAEFERRLAAVPADQRDAVILDIVRTNAAAVLGRASAEELRADHTFKELGFDSLGALELRNRITSATGLRLPATLAFDHPTPAAVVALLRGKVEGQAKGAPQRAVVAAAADEPIAIVGMACRYPGGVRTPEDFWHLLETGTDAISPFPDDRGWQIEALYHPDPDHPGTTYTREGGFIDGCMDFDPAFFGISPREGLAMDPQQRLLLEVAWEAFENAGIDPTTLRGSQTGVFAGLMYQNYGPLLHRVPPELEGYLGTGTAGSVASGRIAYTLGFEGPAVTLDTACSSSLVSLHMACQALRSGECTMALAGGVTILTSPGIFIEFSRQRGVAVDGRCKSFAADADGTGWSEGVGLVLVERLSDARRLGHDVLAVVRGSAVNQDGASNGLTAPNGPSQERVIRQALANARVPASDVDAVEAHGTGTMLGDPIEAEALLATYGQERGPGHPLWLGAVKSNIAHSQAAAGVAGVIKMVLALQHELLPKTLHVKEGSRKVDWESGAVSLLAEPVAWPRHPERPRRAGVSSFGVSGTNAHVILEQAPALDPVLPPPSEDRAPDAQTPATWLLSAKSERALRDQAERLQTHIDAQPDLGIIDVARSLATTRTALEHRAAVIGATRDEFFAGLRAVMHGEPAVNVVRGAVRSPSGKLAFLFAGQGRQRPGMGHELSTGHPAFAAALNEACAELDLHLQRPLKEVMWAADGTPEAELLHQTGYAQPALFALEVALFRLVESWGLRPDYLIGHSIGELAAAQVAGVLSLADAAALVAARGRLMQALPPGGAMVSVQASEEEVLESLGGLEDSLAVAAVNGPASVVVSGDEQAMLGWATRWGERGRKTARLRVSHAFHSPRMEPILADFAEVARGVSFSTPGIPIVSNLTGAAVGPGELTSPDYWVRHVRETVRFLDGIRWLEDAAVTRFLELGPDSALSAMVSKCVTPSSIRGRRSELRVPTLSANRPEQETVVSALAELHADGLAVDWRAVLGEGRRVDLPTYAFQRQRYFWSPAPGSGDLSAVGLESLAHPLLGTALRVAGSDEWIFTGLLSLSTHTWLEDHTAAGRIIVSASTLLELTLRAGRHLDCELVEELTVDDPLVLPEEGSVQVQLRVGEADVEGRRTIAVFARREGGDDDVGPPVEWTRHASGIFAPAGGSAEAQAGARALAEDQWPPVSEPVGVEGLYDRLFSRGLEKGPAFQGLRGAWGHSAEVLAKVTLPEDKAGSGSAFEMHPALLDAASHVLSDRAGKGALPLAFRNVRLHAAGAHSLRVRLRGVGNSTSSLVAVDDAGHPVISIGEIDVRPLAVDELHSVQSVGGETLFRLDWVKAAIERPAAGPGYQDVAVLGAEAAYDLVGAATNGACIGAAPGNGHGATDGDHVNNAGFGLVGVRRHADLDALALALDDGSAAPATLVVPCAPAADSNVASAAHALVHGALATLQAALVDQRLAGTRVVFVTRGAQGAVPGDAPDPAAAPVWGLVRAAQAEHPGRFALVDLDGTDEARAALALALASDEPQLGLRGKVAYVPLVDRAPRTPGGPLSLRRDGTVLVTGGTTGLGALVARHLVAHHGARHLVLISRRGPATPGIKALERDLTAAGADVTVAACDVADRAALERLLGALPADRPLTAVVHAAGELDDGRVESLTPDRVSNVLRAKVDGALHLDALTADCGLAAFVLFSSARAVLGAAGQASYAAANACLDALAQQRHARGLPATAQAWGPWLAGGMTVRLSEADRARLSRTSLTPLGVDRGLKLFDSALAAGHALVLPVRFSRNALRALTENGTASPLLRGLVPPPLRRASVDAHGASTIVQTLATLRDVPENERDAFVLRGVRTAAAAVLGQPSLESVEPERPLLELGLDSLEAVQLHDRLTEASGLDLPATLVVDHPTPTAIARYLCDKLDQNGSTASPADGEVTHVTQADEGDGMLTAVLRDAHERGLVSEVFPILLKASSFRPTFSTPRGGSEGTVRLATGSQLPRLVCVHAFVPGSGQHQFARLAAALGGEHEVSAVAVPGFRSGEALPASRKVAIESLTRSILHAAGGGPFVLVGYSSGGVLARAAIEKLEWEGVTPAGLILIDTHEHAPNEVEHAFVMAMSEMLNRNHQYVAINDHQLVAMGAYMRMFREWTPASLETPSLLLRASHPMLGGALDDNRMAQCVVEVDGDHFSILDEDVATTARAVDAWVEQAVPGVGSAA